MSHARKISSRRRARETGASSEVDLQAKQELKERVEKYFLEFDADKTDRLEAAEVREILKRENERDVARRRAAAQTASDVATTALLESAEEGGGNGGGHGGSGAPTEPPPCANGPTAVTATAAAATAIVEDGLATDLALDGTVRHVPPDGITRGALVDELVKLKAYLAQQMFIDKMLREFDTDQSGYLTANELPGLLKKVMGNSSAVRRKGWPSIDSLRRSVGRSIRRQSVSQSVSQPVSQSASQPASQPVSQSVS